MLRTNHVIISNWLAAHDVSVDHILMNNKDKIEIALHKLEQ